MEPNFVDRFQLIVLAFWLGLGGVRMGMQYAQGGRVLAVDAERTASEISKDLLAGSCLVAWCYEIVAQGWPLRTHIVPEAFRVVIVDVVWLKALGVLLWFLALGVYALAMKQMAGSWRIGIDRSVPGALVTIGIFSRSRNPIYLSFDLAVWATFLVTGRFDFLLLAVLVMVLLHDQIRREERFLLSVFGDEYRRYCERVRRYA